MFSIASIAETLPKVWERDPQIGREGLDSLRRMTQGALAEMRMLLIELRPAALLEKSLGDLLRQLTAAVGARSEIMITTTITGDHLLSDQTQIALYRIAQEALNNVTKHSASTQAKLGLYCTPKQVTLQISDNGQGFDLQQQRIGGRFGLTIMAERAEEIGAEFAVMSQPSEGTQVTVVWNASHDGE
jgi:signal transduction histidine kinase